MSFPVKSSKKPHQQQKVDIMQFSDEDILN